MTQTSERPGLPGAVPDLETDIGALRVALAEHPFPTHQDDLIAQLIARHEPVRLACRLSSLSRTRTYHSLDEVCENLRSAAAAG